MTGTFSKQFTFEARERLQTHAAHSHENLKLLSCLFFDIRIITSNVQAHNNTMPMYKMCALHASAIHLVIIGDVVQPKYNHLSVA